MIGYTGARFPDPVRYALDLLGASLAGQGGRLFTNLRDRKSLAYSVTSFSRVHKSGAYRNHLFPGYRCLV